MTTKLLNLEAVKTHLCPIHIIDNCGIHHERNLNNNERSRNILMSTIAKIIHDLMGHFKHDSIDKQMIKRQHKNILNCPDTYKQQVDVLIETYGRPLMATKKIRAVDMFIIDEYAMINPETLYFLIKFLEITSNATTVIFVLSGDPDQMEPINHDLRDLHDDGKYEQG